MTSSKTGNIFLLDGVVHDPEQEHTATLYQSQHIQIKRIISQGHASPPDQWYDQAEDEWVMLLQGSASLEFDQGRMVHLKAGDHLKIDAGNKHRVSFTSKNPPCIWVAVHVENC